MQLRQLTFLACLYTSCLAASSFQDVLDCITTVDNEVTTFGNQVVAFPSIGGTMKKAWDIHSSAYNIIDAVRNTTDTINDIQAPVDSIEMFDAPAQKLIPAIKHGLAAIIEKKDAMATVGIGRVPAIIALTLINLKNSVIDLETAILSITPLGKEEMVVAFIAEIKDELATAMTVYQHQ
ncbi:hypothetical protein NP233_g31 [Leucocoprinus birnbaumii]|uniref:Cell wall galactomannoprotein n=1 Tax=Leucocoprinus birnbaumii TaxID=56174 RepID=A0AAD5YW62_9AGAR|nr:hypothetical protein NP233_g31 [Leucocoprinus birnbaumii]